MNSFFKIIAFIFSVLFIWAAILQYNDPDPIMWYSIYGVAAIASLLFAFKMLSLWMALILFFAFLIGADVDWPTQFEGYAIGEGDIKNIEMGRESSGLILCALVMLLYAWRIRKGWKP